MNWLRRLRYHPKLDDVVCLILIVAVVPGVWAVCALLVAIFDAWEARL